jgi:neutral ceramidase
MTAPNGLRVGAARTVITPPIGVSLAGSYSDRRAVGVHDELYARAFVAGDGEARIAVISCDLIGVRASTVAGARRLIEQTCGIPGDHVLIAATHNHSGPLTRELVASGLAGEPDEAYLAQLERQIASAVQVADWRAAPARLRLAVGAAPGVAFNRRFVMREGPVRTNPGKQNPDIQEEAAPVDPRVWTLTALPARDGVPAEGSEAVPPNVVPLGMLVNFGLHPAIVGGTVIGGDFPSYLESGVQRLLGPGGNGYIPVSGDPAQEASPVVVFANAPCGDINHVDVSHGQRQGGFAEAARAGTILAGEVAKTACRLVPEWEARGDEGRATNDEGAGGRAGPVPAERSQAYFRGVSRRVDLPLRRPAAEEVAWAREAARGRMTMVPGGGLEVVEAQRILALAEGWTGETHTTEVQALAVGDDLAIAGLPGEVFVELGLELRERSPFRHTLVIGLANEAIGYVPTRRAFEEGGYEPTSSRLLPGGGERLIEETLAMLSQLRR